MMKKIGISLAALWILLFAISMGRSLAAKNAGYMQDEGPIVGIEDPCFFEDIPGVFYVYFGRPTCTSCLVFEPILESALQENHWTVYYFDTAYWKDHAQYERILEKYQVDSVPTLVKMVDGEFEASYLYDLEEEKQAAAALEEFFIPKATGFFSVTSNGRPGMANFPIQFHDRLMVFTFLGLAANVVYLFLKRRKILAGVGESPLLMIFVNSTILILLHMFIAGLGFSFALQYDASPDLSLLGMIGKATWLTITPGLYALILLMCVAIYCDKKRKKVCLLDPPET